VAFGLKMRKMDKETIRREVMHMLEVVDLAGFENRFPREMSGGQRQRVALARALVIKPDLLMFDEPLSNLDAKMRVEMRAEIIRLHNRLGATMIYVTHDQTEAMTMGERIVVMNEGRVQQVSRPLDLYEKPANEFVAGFIGTPPMNIFPAGLLCACRAGLRPEHIAIGRAAADGGAMTAEVDFTESLGSETLVHVLLRGVPVTVRVPGFAAYRAGEKPIRTGARQQRRCDFEQYKSG
jgi:ABC-type sugar transport system ATPase subunit